MPTPHNNNDGIPEEFLDPITQTLMRDPVIVLSSGVIIDRSTSKRIPISVRPARDLKAKIDLWRETTAPDGEHAGSSIGEEVEDIEGDNGYSIVSDPMNLQGETNTKTVSIDDALAFLGVVKERYSHRPEIYQEFIKAMKVFNESTNENSTRRDEAVEEAMEQVAVLFSENPDIWAKFLVFCPKAFHLETACVVQWISKKMTTYKDRLFCVICCQQERNVVCFPCAHLAMCEACFENLEHTDTCPICNIRGAMTHTERIHMC